MRSIRSDNRSEPVRDRQILAGFAWVGFAVFVGIATTVASSAIAAIAIIAVPGLLAIGALASAWKDLRAIRAFRSRHATSGRDLLIVYSASPVWGHYIEDRWLARWSERAVVLNRSSPEWHHEPEAELWRRMAGRTEHTPVAIVVPRKGHPEVVRFYSAFRDYKHGRPTSLLQREHELEAALDFAAS